MFVETQLAQYLGLGKEFLIRFFTGLKIISNLFWRVHNVELKRERYEETSS